MGKKFSVYVRAERDGQVRTAHGRASGSSSDPKVARAQAEDAVLRKVAGMGYTASDPVSLSVDD